ncbi:MAG: hypothetical protein WCW17_02500 [Patescibacteria group bacterium]|jgi:hypothetical protein
MENTEKPQEKEYDDWKAPEVSEKPIQPSIAGEEPTDTQLVIETKKKEESEREISEARSQLAQITESQPDNYSSGTRLVKEVEKILEDPDKYVGRGAEKIVLDHPSDPDKVVAKFHAKPDVEYMKQQYYLNKLLHIFLPHNIPDVHMVVTDPPLLVSDKIKPPEKINPVSAFLKKSLGRILLKRKLNKLDVFIDGNDCNLIFDQNGSLNYVDSPTGGSNLDKLRKVADQRLHDEDLEKAHQYIDRLELWKRRKRDFKL